MSAKVQVIWLSMLQGDATLEAAAVALSQLIACCCYALIQSVLCR